MISGEAIVSLYEKKFQGAFSEERREFLVELIEAGMKAAYEVGQQDIMKLAKYLMPK